MTTADEGDSPPAWLIYERCVAAFASAEHGNLDITVQPNVLLLGAISGTQRQIDVLVDHRWDQRDTTSRIIIDAKNRVRPVDIGDVDAFDGMMKDCRAPRGIIVCTAGCTEAAVRRAQDAITIDLLSFDDALDEFGWAYEPCLGPCSNGKSHGCRGGVLWGEFQATGFDGNSGWVMLQTGKCDGCHSFHVWCQDCGGKFAVPDARVVTCGCDGREWASVPESEASGHVGEPSSIWLMMREYGGRPTALDRRPIR